MARVTVEDCLVHISSPFVLTRVAAKRARQLVRGAPSTHPIGEHKSTVIALQEIASGQIDESILSEPDLPQVQPPGLDLEPLDSFLK